MNPKSLFSLNYHLKALSKDGDPLDVLPQNLAASASALNLLRDWSAAMAPRVLLKAQREVVIGSDQTKKAT